MRPDDPDTTGSGRLARRLATPHPDRTLENGGGLRAVDAWPGAGDDTGEGPPLTGPVRVTLPEGGQRGRYGAPSPHGSDVYEQDYGDDDYDDDYGDDGYGEDGYDDDLDDGRPRRRGRRLLILLVILLLLAAAGGYGWLRLQSQIDPPGPPGETVLVEIAEGTSTADIGRELADQDVIANATLWGWYTRVRDVGSIQAGQYEMQRNSSFSEAIAVLEAGPAAPLGSFVTVPEGFTLTQTVARIADPDEGIEGFTAEEVQAALIAGDIRSAYLPDGQQSLEGMLFPETYRIDEGDGEVDLVADMVAQFDAVMGELDAETRAADLDLTPYEVVIVASLVEEEARIPEERPQVARVIYNRMAAGQPLGIDATSCYTHEESPCELTDAELEDAELPYNTRNREGLPPTPIASPGRASLEAALAPAEGDWLYYVLDADGEDGSHVFTADYDEFVAARERCADAGMGCG